MLMQGGYVRDLLAAAIGSHLASVHQNFATCLPVGQNLPVPGFRVKVVPLLVGLRVVAREVVIDTIIVAGRAARVAVVKNAAKIVADKAVEAVAEGRFVMLVDSV